MGIYQCFFAFMHLVSSFLLFHLAFSTHFTSSIQPICHVNERSALLQFKQSLSINESASCDPSAYPKVASWKPDKENSNCCLWDGIKCDEQTGHVVKLDLTSSFLYGSINSNSSLFQLVHLQWLSLADNDFEPSSIPSAMINLSRISYLNLSFSGFSGQIPSEILELSKLVFLDLSRNYLELLNPSLTNLVEKPFNLNVLDLSYVKIFSSIPPALTNLNSLTFLSLRQCELQGKILPSIGNLTNLFHMDISSNNFQSELPTSIGNLRSLSYLDVGNCSLTKEIPPSIGNLTNLFHLDISSNSFEGELPTSIGNLRSLSYLDVSSSFFSAKFPLSICNLTNLFYLDISRNRFEGELPTSIGNLRSLSYLDVSSSLFPAKFPLSICNLTNLFYLDISNNSFSEGLPTLLGNLTQLTHLYLLRNNLTGEIPFVLMKLTQLTELFLSYNQLTGPIPTEIGNLTHLQLLSLRENQLDGSIPNSIYDLKDLVEIDLSFNNLSGTVDLNMFLINFRSLRVLVLSSNNFVLLTRITLTNTNKQKFEVIGFRSCNLCEFPYFLHNQHHLLSVDLSSNKIVGQVPRWFLNVSTNSLLYLNLSNNLLSGFESNLQEILWTAKVVLDLRFNKLQGPLPVPSMSISSYLISSNQLTGEIPPKICSLKSLHALDLSYNNLSGMLPECLGNLSYKLSVLKLQGNNFRGNIPRNFVNGTSLRIIDLSNNSLQGRIPQSLANCGKLKFLNLGNNQITGTFPSWLGILPELEVLILKFNRFYGVIKGPEKAFEFPRLRIIDLSHNRFAGILPSKYFNCWNAMKDINASKLTYLEDQLKTDRYAAYTTYGISDYSLTLINKGTEMEHKKLSNLITAIIFSNNNFGGEIPPSIANLKGLRTLDLSNNNLEGHIPSSLTGLMVLESLDLSTNNFSGEIPPQLVELATLEFFNVSDNNLSGSIPWKKQLSTFDNRSFDGNPGLCGEPLSRKCEKSEVSQEENLRQSEPLFAFSWKIVATGYAYGTIIGLIMGHIFSIRKHEWLANMFGVQLKVIQTRRRSRS